jgi:excisionase family DNA binding protein
MSTRLSYSIREAAQLIGISVRSLRYLLQQGRIGYVKLGRRRLVKHEDLQRLLNKHYCRPVTSVDAEAPIRPAIGGTNNNASKAATSLASRDTAKGAVNDKS